MRDAAGLAGGIADALALATAADALALPLADAAADALVVAALAGALAVLEATAVAVGTALTVGAALTLGITLATVAGGSAVALPFGAGSAGLSQPTETRRRSAEARERRAFIVHVSWRQTVQTRSGLWYGRGVHRSVELAAVALSLTASVGCIHAPSPLTPAMEGSVGYPHRGVLVHGVELPQQGPGYAWLRGDDRHFAIPRFVSTIVHAAAMVEALRPGAHLGIGDLSKRDGGTLLPHLSHRSGRDADLLLYMETLDGTPVPSPGFVHVEPDGLARDDKGKRFLRFDVAREWILVRTLLLDRDARVQWLFCNHNVKAILLDWATARGESGELLRRADETLHEPKPGGLHDDHIHVRTECSPDEVASGCEVWGPHRAWLTPTEPAPTKLPSDAELARELFAPLPVAHAR